MNSFWAGFGEMFRQCGRSAGLFVLAMLAVGGGTAFWERGGNVFLVALVLLTFACLGRMVVKDYRTRGDVRSFPPLSRHDLRLARSKLKRVTKTKRV